jgi:hypothetical protein
VHCRFNIESSLDYTMPPFPLPSGCCGDGGCMPSSVPPSFTGVPEPAKSVIQGQKRDLHSGKLGYIYN